MAPKKEKYLLVVALRPHCPHVVDRVPLVMRMYVSNLRNRPLTNGNINRLAHSIPTLHRLFTGESDQYSLPPGVHTYISERLTSPFTYCSKEQMENTPLSPRMQGPPTVVMSSTGSLVTSYHPDKFGLAELKADSRNQCYLVELDGMRFLRVLAPVFYSGGEEVMGRWRVTDYSPEGHMMLSVFCYFARGRRADCEVASNPKKRKRSALEDGNSGLPIQKRCLRF